MQTDDRARFRAILVGIARVYDREVDSLLLDTYWLALRDWSIEDVERAAAHLLTSSRFMPRPADFAALRRAGAMTAGEAWQAALVHARGAYRAGPSVPPVERAVAALGGWQVIARSSEDSLPFLERRFAEHFVEIEAREEVREALPALVGPSSTFRTRALGPARVGDSLARVLPKPEAGK
jgi:hypothetical protein